MEEITEFHMLVNKHGIFRELGGRHAQIFEKQNDGTYAEKIGHIHETGRPRLVTLGKAPTYNPNTGEGYLGVWSLVTIPKTEVPDILWKDMVKHSFLITLHEKLLARAKERILEEPNLSNAEYL